MSRKNRRPTFRLSFNYSGLGGFDPACREMSELMIEQPDGTLCPCTGANAPSDALSVELDDRPRAALDGSAMDGLYGMFESHDIMSALADADSVSKPPMPGTATETVPTPTPRPQGTDIPLPHERPETPEEVEVRSGETWDKVNNRRIATLHPKVQPHAINFINEVEQELGITLRITQAHRTIEEQDDLYAKGRTKPGAIVTQARGGSSYHNFGLALDVVEMKNGRPLWIPLSEEIAAIGIRNGFAWGGNWNSPDFPHFEMTFGLSTEQLRQGQRP